MDEKQKTYTIFVNAREEIWNEKKISFEQVVILAFGSYSNDPNTKYIVTYTRGEGQKHEGSLDIGDNTEVKEGMIFNVSQTNKG